MCIRDRLEDLTEVEIVICVPFTALCSASQRLNGSQIGLGAVSYTHLRAHETVLDLVCRLLLEKKNKKKQH